MPIKGEYNGPCADSGCKESAALWYNIVSDLYYCSSCAHAINEAHRQQGRCALCVLHLSR